MKLAVIFSLLFIAFLSTLRAVTATTTERLLWGMLAASISLGLAVQLRGDGYYGVLMVAVFVLTDLMVYLFFRSLKLMPTRAALSIRADHLFRVFFIWASFCGIVGAICLAFAHSDLGVWSVPPASGMGLLASRVWSHDWLLVFLPMFGLSVIVTGGFFLVRRDR